MTTTDFSCDFSAEEEEEEEEVDFDRASASSFAKVVLPTHGVPTMIIKGILVHFQLGLISEQPFSIHDHHVCYCCWRYACMIVVQ